ncbi:MAG: hypothetical protein IJV98_00235 [Clostridia bacterium]|nr:hypothetical protein [Clostridia bacterium]
MSKLCADENGDHFCDAQKCGERVSECSDADGDFRCDICEEEIRAVAWIDTDDDGVIDEEETKYLSLEDAFEDADLTVIKLNDDAVDFAFFISDKTVTLDLNGYTVTLDAWFDVADGASFTLKDSSQAMTGRIVCDYNNECYMDVYGTGIFVLESGTVDVLRLNGDNAAVMLNGGTVSTMIVSHGTVAVDDVDVTDWEISGGNFNVDPSTLNGFNSSSYKTVDNGDGTWTVEQEAAVNLVAALRGTSITLEGSIGMHVYFELDQSIVDSESAFVRFALSGGREIEIPVSEGVENTAAMPGQTLYIFTCELYATQMADEITIQVFMDDFSSNEYTHSVVAYANSILSNENGAYREETVALVKAMLNYGAYAQIYFDYNTENLANAELAEGDKDLSSVTVDSFAGYAASGMTMEGIGTFAGSSLVLDSETAMKLYFKPADGVDIDSLTFTLGTEILSPVQSGEYYVLSITNIASNDLDCKFEVNVNNGTKEGSFTCSVYSYCYNVLNSADHPEAHKNVVKALYLYNVAADNY